MCLHGGEIAARDANRRILKQEINKIDARTAVRTEHRPWEALSRRWFKVRSSFNHVGNYGNPDEICLGDGACLFMSISFQKYKIS